MWWRRSDKVFFHLRKLQWCGVRNQKVTHWSGKREGKEEMNEECHHFLASNYEILCLCLLFFINNKKKIVYGVYNSNELFVNDCKIHRSGVKEPNFFAVFFFIDFIDECTNKNYLFEIYVVRVFQKRLSRTHTPWWLK